MIVSKVTQTLKRFPSQIFVGLFFVCYLFLGYKIYKSYNVYIDEPRLRQNGLNTYSYVFKGDPSLLENAKEKYYGQIIEFSFAFIQKTFDITKTHQIYSLRHFGVFLTWFIGILFFYLLCKKRFQKQTYALLATAMLILTPRLFAHSFYNARDIPLLSFSIISMYTLWLFTLEKSLKTFVFHALASSLVMSVRVVGVFIPAITIAIFVAQSIKNSRLDLKKLGFLAGYLLMTSAFFYLFNPIVWRNPIHNGVEMFREMSQYPKVKEVPFFGHTVVSTNLPWYYVPGWLLVTMPVMYSFLFLLSPITLYKKGGLKLIDVIVLLYFLIPLASVLLFNSVLYNGIRHVYFIIPPIVYLSIVALVNTQKKLRYFLLALLLANLFSVIVFMVKNHPYQNLYFNIFAGEQTDIPYRFETDYWASTYKEAFEIIDLIDNRKSVRVEVESKSWADITLSNMPAYISSKMIATEANNNLNYSLVIYKPANPIPTNTLLVHTIYVKNAPILGIYKFNH